MTKEEAKDEEGMGKGKGRHGWRRNEKREHGEKKERGGGKGKVRREKREKRKR